MIKTDHDNVLIEAVVPTGFKAFIRAIAWQYSHLGVVPKHLVDMVTFSLTTGLRRSVLRSCNGYSRDRQRKVTWIHGDQAKAGKLIHVTLNATAIAVTKQIGKHSRSVFSYKSKPITQVNTKAWHKALKRAVLRIFADMIYAIRGQAG